MHEPKITLVANRCSELGMASFEPHLVQAVAKNAVKTLGMFCVKCEGLLPTSDQPIYTAVPNNSVSGYLNMNIELANLLYYMHQSIWKILEEYPEKTVDIVKQGAEVCVSHEMKPRLTRHVLRCRIVVV